MKHRHTIQDLYSVNHVYDIVLSDFGRDSALNLLREVSMTEKALISSFLSRINRRAPFLDEYRRIMFTAVGDVAYIKHDFLERANPRRVLPRSVLFGVDGTEVSNEHVRRMCEVLSSSIESAAARGYDHFRVIIPCNTLAWVDDCLLEQLSARFPSATCAVAHDTTDAAPTSPTITLYSVPRSVIAAVAKGSHSKLMVLGTDLARASYAATAKSMPNYDVEILPVTNLRQRIMDDLLLASIANDWGGTAEATTRLEQHVLAPMRKIYSPFEVIQGSTDFDLGIGSSSLRILARQLVLDVYGPHLGTSAVDMLE